MKATQLLAVMRVAEVLKDTDTADVEGITAALAQVRTDLAAGEVDIDAFIKEQVKGRPSQEVLDAAAAEGPYRWKDGRKMFGGDFMVAYSQPSFMYGIALGLYLALDSPDEKGGA